MNGFFSGFSRLQEQEARIVGRSCRVMDGVQMTSSDDRNYLQEKLIDTVEKPQIFTIHCYNGTAISTHTPGRRNKDNFIARDLFINLQCCQVFGHTGNGLEGCEDSLAASICRVDEPDPHYDREPEAGGDGMEDGDDGYP